MNNELFKWFEESAEYLKDKDVKKLELGLMMAYAKGCAVGLQAGREE